MRSLANLALLVAMAACQSRPAAEVPATGTRADSIVLERSRCFGACPAYRLSLTAAGAVTITPRSSGDTTASRQAMSKSMFALLAEQAQQIGFFTLPPVIADDATLCPLRATDHATAVVTIFRGDSATQVIDYLGCYKGTDLSVSPQLGRLRLFESHIDRVAQSARAMTPR